MITSKDGLFVLSAGLHHSYMWVFFKGFRTKYFSILKIYRFKYVLHEYLSGNRRLGTFVHLLLVLPLLPVSSLCLQCAT